MLMTVALPLDKDNAQLNACGCKLFVLHLFLDSFIELPIICDSLVPFFPNNNNNNFLYNEYRCEFMLERYK